MASDAPDSVKFTMQNDHVVSAKDSNTLAAEN